MGAGEAKPSGQKYIFGWINGGFSSLIILLVGFGLILIWKIYWFYLLNIMLLGNTF
jgi:hypothetical protein